MRETAEFASGLWGEKLYQRRAREALPLLVRQAEAGKKIYYSDLASELGMPNPRNLNYPLGCIGNALLSLSERWGDPVPPVQCLVVNKRDDMPGEGIWWFLPGVTERLVEEPPARRRRLLDEALAGVFAYPWWREVLRELGLPDPPPFDARTLAAAALMHAGGEGEAHRRLKERVAARPELLGLPIGTEAEIECRLPSGDAVDVLFRDDDRWHAAEIKPEAAPEPDLIRGLFQCVKDRAVLEAWQAALGIAPGARAVLVLGGRLPSRLHPLKYQLGVETEEEVLGRS